MILQKFERCTEENDPNRCQAVGQHGQCPFKAMPGLKTCPRHGGQRALNGLLAKERRIYQIAQWQDKINNQADHPKIKDLREELAILRMVLETKLESCHDNAMILMAAGHITEMIREIAKTVRICHALELSLNTVMDKTQASAWVQEIGEILSTYVNDADVLQMISEDMMLSLERYTAPKDPSTRELTYVESQSRE